MALALLALCGISHAQQAATAGAPSGRLGQRYVGTSYGIADYQGLAEEFHDASLGVNLPVTKALDVDFGYGYQWLRNNPVDVSAHSLDAGATLYTAKRGVKPFVSASLAYVWTKYSFAGNAIKKDDEGVFGVALGLETSVGPIVLTPSVGYSDSFKDNNPAYSYGIDAHYWLTQKIGLRAALSYSDYDGDLESLNYRVGVRVSF
ncbi:MAG: outer membrane beta-barrel protein [Verrucomicrobiota bacterium]